MSLYDLVDEPVTNHSGGYSSEGLTVNTEEKLFKALEMFNNHLGHYPTMNEWDDNKDNIGVLTGGGHIKRNTGMGLAEAKDILGADRSRYQSPGKVHSLTDEMKKQSPEKAYLIGVLLGDGSLFEDGRTTKFSLQTKDKDFADEVARCLKEWIKQNADVKVYGPYEIRDNSFSKNKKYGIQKGSKAPFKELMRIYKSEWDEILEELHEYKQDLLRGLWDSEGHVGSSKRIGFTNTDEGIVKMYSHLVADVVGVKLDESGEWASNNESGINYGDVHITKEQESGIRQVIIPKKYYGDFVDKVNPTIKRKIGGEN